MNKKSLLLVLLALLTCSLVYAVWRTPRQERVVPKAGPVKQERKRPAAGRGVEMAAISAEDDLLVRLDLLNRQEGASTQPRRDLFAPLHRGRSAGVATVSPPAVAMPPKVEEVEPQPPSLPPPPPPPPQTPPAGKFTVLGFLQKEVERKVFVSVGGEIFVAREGDWFGRNNQFHIVELTAERVTIRDKDYPQPVSMTMADKSSSPVGGAGLRNDGRSPTRRPTLARLTPPEVATEESATAENAVQPPAATTTEGQGILRPLPRSNFNNLFSEEKGPVRIPPAQRQSATRDSAPPVEEDSQ